MHPTKDYHFPVKNKLLIDSNNKGNIMAGIKRKQKVKYLNILIISDTINELKITNI